MTDQRDAMEHFIAGLPGGLPDAPQFVPAQVQTYLFGDQRPKGDTGGGGHVWSHWHAEKIVPQAWRCPDTTLVWNAQTGNRYSGDYEQAQGAACLRTRDGWTALSWWDRSGDRRGGANTTLVAKGAFTFEQMLELLRVKFPQIHERQPCALFLREPLEVR